MDKCVLGEPDKGDQPPQRLISLYIVQFRFFFRVIDYSIRDCKAHPSRPPFYPLLNEATDLPATIPSKPNRFARKGDLMRQLDGSLSRVKMNLNCVNFKWNEFLT